MFKDDLEIVGVWRVAKFIQGYLLLTLRSFIAVWRIIFSLLTWIHLQIELIVLFLSHASPIWYEEYRGKLIEFFLLKEKEGPWDMELTLLTLASFPETTYPQHRCSERWRPHNQTATGRRWASPGTLSFVEGWKEEQESFEVCLSIFIFCPLPSPLKLTQRYGPLGPSTQHSLRLENSEHQMNRT